MRDAHFRQQTAKAAESIREAEADRQAIRQERETRVNQIDTLAASLYQELIGDQSRLTELLETDPHAYLRVKQDMDRKAQLLQQAGQHRHTLMQQQAADAERETVAFAKAEREKLHDKLPEWRDAKVRSQEQTSIATYLREMGYSDAELGDLMDHRALLIARDAMKFRAQQQVRSKQATAKPTAKAVAPQARQSVNTPVVKLAELQKRAASTRDPDDVVAYMVAKEAAARR